MKAVRTLFILSNVMLSLLFINVVNAHQGHEDEDIILSKLGDLGDVSFPVSCSPTDQKSLNTGVGLLHHMMYAQAEQFFADIIKSETKCAMIYWGYSMSLFHPLWPDTITKEAFERGKSAITTAQKLTKSSNDNKSEHSKEKAYINAAAMYYQSWQETTDKARILAWANAQKTIYQQYPNDIDALAFYALSQLSIAPTNDPSFAKQQEMGSLLTSMINTYPTHPGIIHYSIHAFDNSKLAKSGAVAAQAYDKIAPDVPHALHMPSHIFVRLGMWDDVINWNIRSAKAALKYPTKGTTSMHYVHAIDYLVYGYLQEGRNNKAKHALSEIEKHHPIQATFPAAYALSAIPARIALESKNWKQASQLKTQTPDYFTWQKFPQIEAMTYFAKGIGSAMNGDIKMAEANLKVLDSLYQESTKISPNYWAILVDAQRKSVNAWIQYQSGNKEKGLDTLYAAADLEDSLDKNPVTPGAVLPARELLADMLLRSGKYEDAIKEYEKTLEINPNRLNSVNGILSAKSKMAL